MGLLIVVFSRNNKAFFLPSAVNELSPIAQYTSFSGLYAGLTARLFQRIFIPLCAKLTPLVTHSINGLNSASHGFLFRTFTFDVAKLKATFLPFEEPLSSSTVL